MLPIDVTIPAQECSVQDARIALVNERYWLHLNLRLRGFKQLQSFSSPTLLDLASQLSIALGFAFSDAQRIVSNADGGLLN